MTKRICLVTHSFYESDNRVIRYAQALAARGDEVHVIALRRNPAQTVDEVLCGVRVHRIQDRFGKHESSRWSFLWPLLRFTSRVSRWLLARPHLKFHVVHVHNIPDFLVFAAWPSKLRGARIILDIHDIVPEFFASKFGAADRSLLVRSLRLMEKASAAMADRIILANHLWLDKYTSRSALPAKCLALVNHVDDQTFRPRAPARRSTSAPRIVFPGGLQWHQGLDIAIRAVAVLRRRLHDLQFDIYGDGNVKAQLVALSAELGLEGCVRFHEPVGLQDIAAIMADADLGVVPKRADSFGNEAYSTKIMEFMAVGVPVVVSSTRVDRHYFDDSVVRFFPSGDHEALADAMHELLVDSGLREAQVARALQYVERNSWARHKARYLDLVDDLIEPRPQPLRATAERHASDDAGH